MIRIVVIHRVVRDAGHVDRRAERRRPLGHRQQREEPAVAQAPDAEAIGVHVRQRLQVVGAHRRVLEIVAADVHVDAFAPRGAVADAAAVVGREDDVALLQQVLVEAVVDGVVPLHVPAVVVLVDAVAVHPDDRRMLLRCDRGSSARRDRPAPACRRVPHSARAAARPAPSDRWRPASSRSAGPAPRPALVVSTT